MDEILRDMEIKGLASTASDWIRRAVIEKPSRINLALATTAILVYDRIDMILAKTSNNN
jgi:hypothetical protein